MTCPECGSDAVTPDDTHASVHWCDACGHCIDKRQGAARRLAPLPNVTPAAAAGVTVTPPNLDVVMGDPPANGTAAKHVGIDPGSPSGDYTGIVADAPPELQPQAFDWLDAVIRQALREGAEVQIIHRLPGRRVRMSLTQAQQ